MKKLKNAVFATNSVNISNVNSDFQEVLYGIYKKVYILASSINYRGGSADACKEYLTNVTINIINGYLNVLEEFTVALGEVKENVFQYETDGKGIVSSTILEQVSSDVSSTYKTNFSTLMADVNDTLAKAANYIGLTSISEGDVTNQYASLENTITSINDDLVSLDTSISNKLDTVLSHITNLEKMIDSMEKTVDAKGNIDYQKVSAIKQGSDFYVESDQTLTAIIKEDPFSYYADGGSLAEKQWAAGAAQDLYVYGGVSAVTGSYSYKNDGGKHEASASGSLLEGNVGVQATEYLNVNGTATVGHGEGKAKYGWSDSYKGVSLEGDISAAKASGKVVLGTEDFNGYIKGDATALGASGYVKAEVESATDFAFGFKGKASAASAKGTIGLSFLEVPTEDENDPTKTTNLFGFSASGKAGVSAGGEFLVESQKVIDTDFVDVNTFTLDVGIEALLGVEFTLTIPYITFW